MLGWRFQPASAVAKRISFSRSKVLILVLLVVPNSHWAVSKDASLIDKTKKARGALVLLKWALHEEIQAKDANIISVMGFRPLE